MPAASSTRNVVISRAVADQDLGLVVDRILRDAGHSTYVQDKDFGAIAFTQRMDEGQRMVEAGGSIVALLSPAYLASGCCLLEAQHPLADDPFNERQRLVVLRIADCEPDGLLKLPAAFDLEPLLGDAEAFARAVRGAVAPEHDAGAAQFSSLFRRSGRQILHAEVREVAGFTGRAAELSAIDAALRSKGGKAALTNAGNNGDAAASAMHGLGGLGKSVLARQYAWLNRARYAGMWWIRAETPEHIVADLAALGARLMPGLEEMPSHAEAAQITLDAITQGGGEKPWLMIYDNVEAPESIAELAPAAHAHVLITSRMTDWSGRAEQVAVDVFPRPLAMEYLLARAHNADAHAAGRLADDLGRLPLALAHARATCWAKGLDFETYRALLPDLIERAPQGAACPALVFATFELAFRHAVERCPQAEPLMGLAAHLAPDRIPLDILTHDETSRAGQGAAIAALSEVSLAASVPIDDGSPGLSVHPLAQAVMRDRLGDRAGEFAGLATRLVAQAYPADPGDEDAWPACVRLNTHAHAVLAVAPDDGDAAQWTSRLLNQLGQNIAARGDITAAEPLMRRALAIDERRFGPEHPDTADAINNLADLLAATGRFADAEPLMRRSLAIEERSNGPEHPSVAQDLSNLAQLLQDTDRLAEAEPLIRRALAIDQKAFGPEHQVVAGDLGNLAMLLKATSRQAEAEPLFRSALAIHEKSLGTEHPSTLKVPTLIPISHWLRGFAGKL